MLSLNRQDVCKSLARFRYDHGIIQNSSSNAPQVICYRLQYSQPWFTSHIAATASRSSTNRIQNPRAMAKTNGSYHRAPAQEPCDGSKTCMVRNCYCKINNIIYRPRSRSVASFPPNPNFPVLFLFVRSSNPITGPVGGVGCQCREQKLLASPE